MMLNNYPDTFTLVQIHVWDAYTTTWGEARKLFYPDVTGTPIAWFDGVEEAHGGTTDVNYMYNWYRSIYLGRQGVPTDVTIRAGGEEVGEQTYKITAQVCVEPGGLDKSVRIHIVQVLDHWPTTGGYHRHGVKQGTDQLVNLQDGECANVQATFTFDPTSWANQDDIKIIVWAQNRGTSGPAEVHQAHTMSWPFPVPHWLCPGDLDWDGYRNITDFTLFADAYPSQEGDPNYNVMADLDEDGFVNITDFTLFANVYLQACP